MPKHGSMTEAVCKSRRLGRGRVIHLGALLALGLLGLLLLSTRSEGVGRGRVG